MFLNENVRISLKIWLKFVPKIRIRIIPALFEIVEPMLEYFNWTIWEQTAVKY